MGIVITILYGVGFVYFFFKYIQMALLFQDILTFTKIKLLTSKFTKILIRVVPFIAVFLMALIWPIAEAIRFVNGRKK